jgi:hypothetical protein
MTIMNPRAAPLGTRAARKTGETTFGQRADSEFESVKDEDNQVVDVRYKKGRCRNPECGKVGRIYIRENGTKICEACSTVQNRGNPTGREDDGHISKNLSKSLFRDFVYSMVWQETGGV